VILHETKKRTLKKMHYIAFLAVRLAYFMLKQSNAYFF